jgi:methylmalonyl-CoA mutase C-terminal domain/subunit
LYGEKVLEELKKRGAADIKVMAGGLVSREDVEALEKMGVEGNYGPGTPLQLIIDHVRKLAEKN